MVWLAVPGEFAGRLQVSRGEAEGRGGRWGPGWVGGRGWQNVCLSSLAGGDPGKAVTAPGTGPRRGAFSSERKWGLFVGWREQKGRKGKK